ncbi:MAG: hypothetical protein EOM12_19030, partial [Verrucomicrobiae bacterium]|nr:hypothetical protein [Verrucomicrobiae bacterium]
ANDARMRVYKDNADIIDGLQWVSTLDLRTTVECFPGETIVTPVGSLQRVYKRRYSGEFIIITTSTGKEIVGTPNHPILTPNGWLALDKVKPNQKVCYTVLDEKGVVLGVQNIGVPTKFSELFDSVYADSISKVFYERASTDQFHGDGMRGDEEVCIVNTSGFLGNDIKLSTNRKEVPKDGLGSGQKRSGFFGLGLLFGLVSAWFPPIPPLKIAFKVLKNSVKPRLSSFPWKLFQNVRRGNPFVKKRYGKSGVCCAQGVSSVSGGVFHNSGIDKKLCSSSGRYSEILGNLVGRLPGSILCDDVISVRSEYRSCHVYNLQSNQGLYIANGFIVKNCAAYDGLVWDLNGNPIGHGMTLDPPPRHWNCRSVLTC